MASLLTRVKSRVRTAILGAPPAPPAPPPVATPVEVEAPAAPPSPPAADMMSWANSQVFELDYWKNHWPYRDDALESLQQQRHHVGEWLLENTGFVKGPDGGFPAFRGRVLEVGCGPMGFFELFKDVEVYATDTLMEEYARDIPFATLGKRGASDYSATAPGAYGFQFDIVVCSNVLDHTADWMAFLEELVQAAKPDGGEIVIYTDYRSAPATGHTQVYNPQQVRRALEWQGLKTSVFTPWPGDDHCDGRVFIRARRQA